MLTLGRLLEWCQQNQATSAYYLTDFLLLLKDLYSALGRIKHESERWNIMFIWLILLYSIIWWWLAEGYRNGNLALHVSPFGCAKTIFLSVIRGVGGTYEHFDFYFTVLSRIVCSREHCVTVTGWHFANCGWWNGRCLPWCWSDKAKVTRRSVSIGTSAW